jgi:4-amino-4-deoxy-L-arabinose transferase-like glycosyltransferase
MTTSTPTTPTTPSTTPYQAPVPYPGEWSGVPNRPAEPELPDRRTPRERLALVALLAGTAVLYLWGLGASGYANDFYSAAVQAGTKSWKAFFFGSFDSSNFITVDKPPAALWPMELSGRIFGFSSWSMLVPQALMGVLSVWLLYATVRRWFGGVAGLFAGVLLAITPVAVLMFRFNNPDAMMTLLVVAAAYCVTRALERASTKWLLLAGTVMGFSFLTKGLQPFTVLPALAVAYLVAAPTRLRRRLWQLAAAGLAVVAGAGWWILAVTLTPASARPYIGGSGDNTALGLAFGYNGLSRITGGSGPGNGGGGGANFSGASGIGRLFNALNGGQIAWLIPTALIAIVALVVVSARAPRVDRTRAAVIVWGGWLLVTGALLSYASGIIHTYYSVELAPAIAALVAIGATVMWRHRDALAARVALAAGALITAWWSWTLLHRSAGWHPWVATLVLVAGLVAAVALLVPAKRLRAAGIVGIVAGLIAIAGGPTAYALDTAATPHTGSTPSAGPAVSNAGGTGGPGGFGGNRPTNGNAANSGGAPNGSGGAANGSSGRPGFGTPPSGSQASGAQPSGSQPSRGTGGFGGGATVSSALVTLLKKAGTTWSAATVGSQSAGPLELQSGTAVMAIGGFSGSDNAPTLAQFEKLVAAGKIHYFIGGGQGGGPGGGGGSGSAIASWVAAHYTATTVGGSTVYDLTKATS